MSSRHAAPRSRRRAVALGSVVVVVLLVVVGAWLLTRGEDPSGTDTATSDEAASAAPTTATTATPEGTPSEEVPDETEATQPTGTAGPGDDGASSGTEDPETASLAGTWATEDNFWVLRLTADGRFEEDFDGVENVRSGTYTLDGTRFTLQGGDGNDNSGVLRGKNRLVFDDQVLRRRS